MKKVGTESTLDGTIPTSGEGTDTMYTWSNGMDKRVTGTVGFFLRDQKAIPSCEEADLCQTIRLVCVEWQADHPGEPMGPGLVRLISRTQCNKYERDLRKHRYGLDVNDPEFEHPPVEGEQEYTLRLTEILGKIVYDEEEALVAFFCIYQEMSLREAADHTAIPQTSIHRILQRLQRRARKLGVI